MIKHKSEQVAFQKVLSKYLAKFACNKWKLELIQNRIFENIVVVPAIQEYENLKTLLNSILRNDPKYFPQTLFLFVINNSVPASNTVKEDNQLSIDFLRSIINRKRENELSAKVIDAGINIGLVDASSPGYELPEKDAGVGLARKIGMDLALSCFDYDSIKKKIIICLDADCKVDENYLTCIVEEVNVRNISAGYVEYEHKLGDTEEEKKAIIAYEIFLRYYVLGLKLANSPYAFDSIGSTMICDAESYVRIGGMNKRKAAEDFYFLEKLAKIHPIEKITSTRVYPSPRKSWRVPFGTGQRVNRFFEGTHDEYTLIDPKCFYVLKQWIELFFLDKICDSNHYMNKAKEINVTLFNFLSEQKFEEAWNKILADTSKESQIQKQKHFWFDGFRTMKLIHHLRDNSYPSINMFGALDQIFEMHNIKISRIEPIPEWKIQLDYLNKLKSIL